MFRYRFVFLLTIFALMVACTSSNADEELASGAVTQPVATAVPIEPTAAPTETPVEVTPETDDLATFVEQLQTTVTNQDYAAMQAAMSDPIAVGGWRSEWRMYEPNQTVAEFQSDALPAPLAVQFSGLSDDELTYRLGQTPASMFGPQSNVVAALHSTGWGVEGIDEALLFVTEEDGRYAWSAFLYTFGSFAQDDTTSSDLFPFVETDVNYITAQQDVVMYSGLGETYDEIGGIFDGQTALVRGQSEDGNWWRVICPDDTIGDCWVTADPAFTIPTGDDASQPDRPDPATLAVVSEITIASPDGDWRATALQTEPVVVGDLEQLYVSLIVTDGATTWHPVAEWRGYGLGYIWPAVVQWSADGRYLYYTNLGSPDGCAVFINGTDLHRLDVTDGSVDEILPANSTFNLSLSPDQTSVAYIANNGRQNLFVLQNVDSGTEASLALTVEDEFVQTYQLYWSADGETAVLTLVHDTCLPTETTSIVRVDLDPLTAQTLVEKDDRQFSVSEWPDPAQADILLVDKDGQLWSLDIDSGAVTQ